MKTIKHMLDLLLHPDDTVLAPTHFEANQEFDQALIFSKMAEQYHLAFLNHDAVQDLSGLAYRNAVWNYLSAALRGHSQAQYQLGMAYFEGQLGLLRDYAQAERWFTRAAQRGHRGAKEQLDQIHQLVNFS